MSEPSLLERLAAEPIMRGGSACTIAVALRKLPEADRATLLSAIADTDTYTNRRIAGALTKAGIAVRDQTVARHRRGGCGCHSSTT